MLARSRLLYFRLSFLCPLFLTFLIGGWILFEIRSLVLTANWVSQSQQITLQISDIEEHLSHAESALRGYLLTDKKEFLDSYKASATKVQPAIQKLEQITPNFPEIQDSIPEVQHLARSWIYFGEYILQKNVHLDKEKWIFNEPERPYKYAFIQRLNRLKASITKASQAKSQYAKSTAIRTFSIGLLAFTLLAIWMALALRRIVQQEKKLRESENEFRSLFENSSEAIIVIKPDKTICMANQQSLNQLGYEPDELIKSPLQILFPNSDSHLQLPSPQSEIPIQRKDGSTFPAEISISQASPHAESLQIMTIRDISLKKRAEEHLVFTANFTEILQESLDIQETLNKVVHQCTPFLGDWCMIYFNDASFTDKNCVSWSSSTIFDSDIQNHFKKMCSQISTNLPSLKPSLVSLKDLPPAELEAYQKKLLEQGISSYLKIPLLARNHGVGMMILLSRYVYTDEEISFRSLMASRAAFAIDNARLYKKSCDAIQARNNILAIVSHDLKNPIGAIQMAAEVMIAEPLDTETRFLLETIQRNSAQAIYLINDLLDLAQVESGNLRIERSPASVQSILTEVENLFQPQAQEKNIHLETQKTDLEDQILCDQRRLLQALSNLLGNALKFTEPGGRIVIREEILENEILISVEDSGIGIKPGAIEHIFEMYWQPEETKKQGSGLGLFITKGIVEAHGGKIWAESEIGKGSRFFILIPQTLKVENQAPLTDVQLHF